MSNAVTTAEAERDLPNVHDERPPPREYTVTFIKDGKPIPDPFSDMPPLEPYELVWKTGILNFDEHCAQVWAGMSEALRKSGQPSAQTTY